jgi:hypothetical protein
MSRPKKTTRKATGRKANVRTPKTATAKRAKIESAAASTPPGDAVIKLLQSRGAAPGTRRPPNNPEVPALVIKALNDDLNNIKEALDTYAKHLRALDRKRLNGVGIKKLGFIERAYELALENGEFLPHYLTLDRFGKDFEYFMDFRSLTTTTGQIREQLWNITIDSADIVYTDALEFYASVREAAKRRVDAAETLFAALSPFFKSWGRKHEGEEAEPTKKEELREAKGLIKGTHDGVLVIENEKPKLTGGKHKFIDESFKDTAEFKDIEQGKITE